MGEFCGEACLSARVDAAINAPEILAHRVR